MADLSVKRIDLSDDRDKKEFYFVISNLTDEDI